VLVHDFIKPNDDDRVSDAVENMAYVDAAYRAAGLAPH
jgi:hypothetical protein